MPTRKPAPIVIAAEVVAERQLYELVLSAIESRCGSYSLDDEQDQRNAAAAIAAELAARGVRP